MAETRKADNDLGWLVYIIKCFEIVETTDDSLTMVKHLFTGE